MTADAPRAHAPAAYNGLKTAWKSLVLRLGGVDAVAACTRAVRSRVTEYGAVHSDRFAPIDIILDAETVAGEPLITSALARAQGYELIAIDVKGEGELARIQARVGRDVAAFFASAADAMLSGSVTDRARSELIAELDALRRDCSMGIAALRALPIVGSD